MTAAGRAAVAAMLIALAAPCASRAQAPDAGPARLVGQQPAASVRSALERVSPELCRAPATGPHDAPKGS